jgi:hypothetical protein
LLHTITAAPAVPRTGRGVRPGTQRGTWYLVTGVLFLCLFMQRFGVPLGGGMILNIVGPLGLGFAFLAAFAGILGFDRARLAIFLALVTFVMLGQVHAYLGIVAYNGVIDMPSMLQWLGITSFTIFVCAERIPEDEFFALVNRFLIVIAFAGIAQFFAQLVGISIFHFTGLLPSSILAERNWNMQIPFGIDDLYKSNGFFLVEPSVASQFLAIGIIIEVLFFRRWLYLVAFGLALVLTLSGTGTLVLATFVLTVALRLGWKGVALAAVCIVFTAVLAGVVMLTFPAVADIAVGRLNEFTTIGTSGFIRFVTPFWLINDVMREYPSAALFGIGAGTSERLTLPYHYAVNTPVKIAVEYGFPVLILYFSLFLSGRRTKRQSALVPPVFVLLMIAGAYQQFAPVMFLMVLLICTVSLTEAESRWQVAGSREPSQRSSWRPGAIRSRR